MMNERNATHATFTIDRVYKSPPSRVFAAWADGDAKSQWFTGGPGWQQRERTFAFRVDSGDTLSGVWEDDTTSDYVSRYEEILPNERIIFSYRMKKNGSPISVSLATVQFKAEGTGTRLVFTEQLACLDGFEDPDGRGREHGTGLLLNRLERYLESETAAV